MTKWLNIRAWSFAVWWIAVTYVLATGLLPNLLLLAVNSVGYLPYSDRPGPGWYRPHLPTKDELQFFFGFAFLLMRGAALYGTLFAALAGVLSFCRIPRWCLRLVASPLAFVSSGIMMAAAGWIIAISTLGVYAAAVCGGLWGLVVFPRLVPRNSYSPPMAIRIIVPLLVIAAFGYWLIRPLLPNRPLTNGKVEIIRRDTIEKTQLNLDYLGRHLPPM